MTTPHGVPSHSVRGGDIGTPDAVDFNEQSEIIIFTLVKIHVAVYFFFPTVKLICTLNFPYFFPNSQVLTKSR